MKGRIERVNQTLQDRLIKELRLWKIHDTDTAFLPTFMKNYNRRFSVAPKTRTMPTDRSCTAEFGMIIRIF